MSFSSVRLDAYRTLSAVAALSAAPASLAVLASDFAERPRFAGGIVGSATLAKPLAHPLADMPPAPGLRCAACGVRFTADGPLRPTPRGSDQVSVTVAPVGADDDVADVDADALARAAQMAHRLVVAQPGLLVDQAQRLADMLVELLPFGRERAVTVELTRHAVGDGPNLVRTASVTVAPPPPRVRAHTA